MNERPLRTLFAGGGTGGHLYPALAIAQALQRHLAPRVCDIRFVGTRQGIEYRLRDNLDYPLELIPVRGFARKFTVKNLLFPFVLIGALIKSNALLSRFTPDLVVGTGGYVSGPIVARAAVRGIPSAIQEQNSFPGFTTRRLAGRVDRVYLGFVEARNYLTQTTKTLVTGNPVRATIGAATRDEALRHFKLSPERKTILALGGSQGARSVNQALLRSLTKLDDTQLIWQTGRRDFAEIDLALERFRARERQPQVRAFPFTERMDLAYAAADVAIARAGALTLAELQAAEIPALLVPYPHAAGDHQTHNARSIEDAGGAEVIADELLAHTDIIGAARELAHGPRLKNMKQALRRMNAQQQKPAADLIAADLINMLKEKGRLA